MPTVLIAMTREYSPIAYSLDVEDIYPLDHSEAVICCDLEWARDALAIDIHDVAELLRMLPNPRSSHLLALSAWHDVPAVKSKVSYHTETLAASPRESGPDQEKEPRKIIGQEHLRKRKRREWKREGFLYDFLG